MKNPFANKRDGATTVSLTVSFRCPDRGPTSVLAQLDKLAANADTSTSEGFSELCADTALLLMRRSGEWLACCGSAEHRKTDDDALNLYDKLAIREAAKFEDRDTGASVDAALAAAGIGDKNSAPPTIAVVCVVACLLGDREEVRERREERRGPLALRPVWYREERRVMGCAARVLRMHTHAQPNQALRVSSTQALDKEFSGDAGKMRLALEELAAAGNADQEVLALELFWVPGDDSETLDVDEVLIDWPELMQC